MQVYSSMFQRHPAIIFKGFIQIVQCPLFKGIQVNKTKILRMSVVQVQVKTLAGLIESDCTVH